MKLNYVSRAKSDCSLSKHCNSRQIQVESEWLLSNRVKRGKQSEIAVIHRDEYMDFLYLQLTDAFLPKYMYQLKKKKMWVEMYTLVLKMNH